MREIQIGEKTLRVRATPLALLFYKQEFNADLIGDLIKMQEVQTDLSKFDSVVFLQMVWAMAKADNPKDWPSFMVWLGKLESFDFADTALITAVMEEATDGFFRGGRKQ